MHWFTQTAGRDKSQHNYRCPLTCISKYFCWCWQCSVVVLIEDKLREEITNTLTTLVEEEGKRCKEHINTAVQQAVESIAGSVKQLLDPILQDLALH